VTRCGFRAAQPFPGGARACRRRARAGGREGRGRRRAEPTPAPSLLVARRRCVEHPGDEWAWFGGALVGGAPRRERGPCSDTTRAAGRAQPPRAAWPPLRTARAAPRSRIAHRVPSGADAGSGRARPGREQHRRRGAAHGRPPPAAGTRASRPRLARGRRRECCGCDGVGFARRSRFQAAPERAGAARGRAAGRVCAGGALGAHCGGRLGFFRRGRPLEVTAYVRSATSTHRIRLWGRAARPGRPHGARRALPRLGRRGGDQPQPGGCRAGALAASAGGEARQLKRYMSKSQLPPRGMLARPKTTPATAGGRRSRAHSFLAPSAGRPSPHSPPRPHAGSRSYARSAASTRPQSGAGLGVSTARLVMVVKGKGGGVGGGPGGGGGARPAPSLAPRSRAYRSATSTTS